MADSSYVDDSNELLKCEVGHLIGPELAAFWSLFLSLTSGNLFTAVGFFLFFLLAVTHFSCRIYNL